MSRVAAVCVLALSIAASAAAQQGETPRPASDANKPRATAPQEQTPAPAPRPPEPAGQSVNIKIDLTIADQTGAAEPARKTVSLMVADRQVGYVRSTAQSTATGPVRLNVDARPQILPAGNIRVMLSLEYPSISQQVTVIVEPGKSLVVTQTADPLSDRKVTVEMRASIVK
jgi:hypothetical protein